MIHVDEEFKSLIPPLSREEYKLLEESCVKEGIRDPLVVWKLPGNEILIDGHNRWEISAHHAGIPFKIVYKEFEGREAVKEWIIKNQLGRRNIPPFVRAELALKLKPSIEKQSKQRMSDGGKGAQISAEAKGETRDKLAKAAGVSHDTIHKVEEIKKKEKDIPKTIEALRKGETSINKVYSDIKAAENENRRQREARELREAEKRSTEYDQKKTVDIQEVIQNKDDVRKMYDAMQEDFRAMVRSIRHMAYKIEDGKLSKVLAAATDEELEALFEQVRHGIETLFKIQGIITEEMDEE